MRKYHCLSRTFYNVRFCLSLTFYPVRGTLASFTACLFGLESYKSAPFIYGASLIGSSFVLMPELLISALVSYLFTSKVYRYMSER